MRKDGLDEIQFVKLLGNRGSNLIHCLSCPARHAHAGKTSLEDGGGVSRGTQPVVLPSNRLCRTVCFLGFFMLS